MKHSNTKKIAMPEISNKKSLLTRLRNINIILFLIVTLIIFSSMFFILQNITNKVSKDYAKLYADNAVGTLNTYLNGEIALITKAAKSNAIIDWFADEEDPVKKLVAYEEMMGIIDVSSSKNLYIGISKTLHEFGVDKNFTIDEIVPVSTFSRDLPKDNWYFECVNSNKDYLLNVDIDKAFNRKLVWLNYKVTRDGKTYGVLCAGLGFSQLVEKLFSEYESKGVRSLIIDEDGFVQMDSTLIGDEDFLYTLDDKQKLTDEFTDVNLLSAVKEYTKEMDGYYNADSITTVLELSDKEYQYASITPIASTTWTVITLYNSSALFDMTNLLPLGAVVIVVFTLFIIAINRAMATLFIKPFKKLMVSIESVKTNLHEPVYGVERDDEIGELSNTVQNMKDNLVDVLGKVNYDALTGIYNRRYFDEHLKQVIKSLSSSNGIISILMLDIDHFKKYNDTYGHNAGDDCLKEIAITITGCVVREGDFVARYGGEEFTIVLPDTDKHDACMIAEKILNAMKDAAMPHVSSETENYVTVSIGITTFVADDTTSPQIYIKRADEALYISKQTGRNKYTIYNQKDDGSTVH